ncbi:MAG: flagellar biosynthesis protein FlhF [SAR86 cluster bacterium]|uniref:Flagellar biosynthesis protein FlhF n=1 Tax=SAR86 cluster bacterium TaxID=2030880 RepID=A0A2A5B5D0_9GAMM|nr:MAG: flagellar biosynthesis protein FlhF [SAR86 cluster bacterium]
MRVERFEEDDMRKALTKVRAELGKDAVLISSRSIDGRVEVMAASDCEPKELRAEMKRLALEKTEKVEEQPEIEHVWEVLGDDVDQHSQEMPSLIDMHNELGRLRKLFEGELAQLSWRDGASREPNRLALLTRLEDAGISRDISDKIVAKALPCQDLDLAWRRVQRVLSRAIKISEHDLLKEGGVIALIGSTGVGKTATAAKIAAQFALRHGRNQVAFITTDSIRVGGQSQLISLGTVLGIPVQVVSDHKEIQNTLESFSSRKLVIIDTAGISQRDVAMIEKLETLANENLKIHPLLVLAATTQESVIAETISAFSNINLAGVVVTKTDESNSIGPVLSGLIRNKLPIAFVTNGQQIPEDLHPARIGYFVNKVIKAHEGPRKSLKVHVAKANIGEDKLVSELAV